MRHRRTALAAAFNIAFMLTYAVPQPSAQEPPTIRNYQTEGSLESLHSIDCIDVSALQPIHTPADIIPAVGRCVAQGDYERAVRLFAVAGIYARFDAVRVTDRSAHQAFSVLTMNTFGGVTEEQRSDFASAMDAVVNSDALGTLCESVRALGPPAYYPTYMIQHGVGAFFGRDGPPIDPDFDADGTWTELLDSYLHCP